MKHFLAIALLAVSFSSQAVVLARLTNIECVSVDGEKTIIMKFDSSKSAFGAQTFEVNGHAITGEIMRGNEYRVRADEELIKFEMKNAEEFTTTMTSKKFNKVEDSAAGEDKDLFDFAGEQTDLLCNVDTKFRLKK